MMLLPGMAIRRPLIALTLILIPLVASACTRYHARPIEPGTAADALTVPDASAVRASAETLRHPLLQPLPIDLERPLDPDAAAVLAVILNPSLRGIRDQRKLAYAQVLQAGILPNPQVSVSAEVPTGGDLNGTTSGFGLGVELGGDRAHHPGLEAAVRQAPSRIDRPIHRVARMAGGPRGEAGLLSTESRDGAVSDRR